MSVADVIMNELIIEVFIEYDACFSQLLQNLE